MKRDPMTNSRILVALVAAAQLTCHQALFTAPPGSTLTLFANPGFIPANGGVSVITAYLIEPSGTVVADGTVVQFFTTLGRIDEQGRTNDGVARVNLVSDSRSGEATVTACSGGAASGGSTPTTTTTPATTLATAPPVVFGPPVFADAVQDGACDQETVTVGSLRPSVVILTAFPTHLTDKRSSLITANVFDDKGNPVSSVPVIFTVEAGPGKDPADTEFMDSQGSPTFTNNNGQAQDILRTNYNRGASPKVVTVKARVAVGATAPLSDSVDVTIN
jgi:hypothetical protein